MPDGAAGFRDAAEPSDVTARDGWFGAGNAFDRDAKAVCTAVCWRVEGRLDEVLAAMQSEIVTDRNIARKLRADDRPLTLRHVLRRNVEIMLRLARGGSPLSASEASWLRTVGAWSAREGITRERLVSAIQKSALVCMRFFAEEFRSLPPSSALVVAQSRITEQLYGHVTVVSRSLLRGYLGGDEEEPATTSSDDEFVIRLLTRTWNSDQDLQDAAHEAGFPLGSECAFLVLLPGAASQNGVFDTRLRHLTEQITGSWLVKVPGHPVDHAVMLLPTVKEAMWGRVVATTEQHVAAAGLAGVHCLSSTQRLAFMYQRSLQNVELIRSLAGGCGLVALDEIEVCHLVTSATPVEHQSYAAETLGRLMRSDDATSARLRETLEALLSGSGKTSEVAEQRCLDVKTIQNHLRQIKKLTGLDVKNPAQRFRLQLALLYWNTYAADLSPGGDDQGVSAAKGHGSP